MRYLFVAIGSIVLLGLSVWAIAPAPTRWLLTFAVGAPEISPWLIVGNLIFLSAGLLTVRQSGLGWVTVAVSCLALILSAYPLSQFHAANQAANQALVQGVGADYPVVVAPALEMRLRSQPFVLADSFRGIATAPGRETTGIPFARPDGVPLTLSLYQPAQSGTYPGIVMIYGGSWQTGSPADNATFARHMANQGYVVWAISYRHAPEYQFPAQMDDVEAALEFLKDHADEYGTDANRVALLGRSAGAQLAMLAAYQPGPLSIRAVVDYYGPIDLINGYYDIPKPNPLDVRDVLETFLGGTPDQVEERYRNASPSSYVAPNLPPSLLIYGGKDHIVEARFGQAMAERLEAAGNRVGFIQIPWADHAFDAVFNGVSNQLALYYTERFLAWALR